MAKPLDTRWLMLEHLSIPGWPSRVVDANTLLAAAGKKATEGPSSTGANAVAVAARPAKKTKLEASADTEAPATCMSSFSYSQGGLIPFLTSWQLLQHQSHKSCNNPASPNRPPRTPRPNQPRPHFHQPLPAQLAMHLPQQLPQTLQPSQSPPNAHHLHHPQPSILNSPPPPMVEPSTPPPPTLPTHSRNPTSTPSPAADATPTATPSTSSRASSTPIRGRRCGT